MIVTGSTTVVRPYVLPRPTRPAVRFGNADDDKNKKPVVDAAPVKTKKSFTSKIGTVLLALVAGFGGSAIHDGIRGNIGQVSAQRQPMSHDSIQAMLQSDRNVSDRSAVGLALQQQREVSRMDSIQEQLNLLAYYVKPAVVRIDAEEAGTMGSGFFVRSNGTIVTNFHVVDDGHGKALKTVTVRTFDGRKLTGEVRGANKEKDLAVVKVDIDNAVPLKIAPTDPQAGDLVATMGHPLGLTYFMSFGIIGANNKTLFFKDDPGPTQAHLSDAQFNHGISGGPMVNLQGEVVGVNRAMIPGEGGFIGVSIPGTDLAKELDKLINGHQ